MTCDICLQRLATQPAGQEDAAVAAHLAQCAGCREAQHQLAAIDQTLQRTPQWAPPANFAQRVVAVALRQLAPEPIRVAGLTPDTVQMTTNAVVVGLSLAAAGFVAWAVVAPALTSLASSATGAVMLLCGSSLVWGLWIRRRLARF